LYERAGITSSGSFPFRELGCCAPEIFDRVFVDTSIFHSPKRSNAGNPQTNLVSGNTGLE